MKSKWLGGSETLSVDYISQSKERELSWFIKFSRE